MLTNWNISSHVWDLTSDLLSILENTSDFLLYSACHMREFNFQVLTIIIMNE